MHTPSCDGSEGPSLGNFVNVAGDMQHNPQPQSVDSNKQPPEHIFDITSPFAHGSSCLSISGGAPATDSSSQECSVSGSRDMNYYEYASTTLDLAKPQHDHWQSQCSLLCKCTMAGLLLDGCLPG